LNETGVLLVGTMNSPVTWLKTTHCSQGGSDAGEPSSRDACSGSDSNVPDSSAGVPVRTGPSSEASLSRTLPHQHILPPDMFDPVSLRYVLYSTDVRFLGSVL